MKDISKTQKRIYEYLLERSQDGVPPSVREIGAAVGLSSTSSVQANLDALEQAGYIQRDPLKKRTIRILGREDNVVTNVPIVGTVRRYLRLSRSRAPLPIRVTPRATKLFLP